MIFVIFLQAIIILVLIAAMVWERRSMTRTLLLTGMSHRVAYMYQTGRDAYAQTKYEGPIA